MKCKLAIGSTALIGVLTGAPLFAENDYDVTAELELTQKNAFRIRTDDGLAQNKQIAKVKITASPSYSTAVTVIARGEYDHYYDKDRFADSDVNDHKSDAELREGYLDIFYDNFALRLGKQQVTWGESDNFRVLDVINSLDMRDFLLPYIEDFLEARNPLTMVNLMYQGDIWESQLLYIPDFEANRLASVDADFADYQLIALNEMFGQPIEQRPDAGFGNAAWGMSTKGSFDVGDIGFYGYSGWNPQGTLSFSNGTPLFTYHRRQLVGFSFSGPVGGWVLRSDLGYRFNERFSPPPTSSLDFVEHDVTEWLVGADYSHGSLNVSFQLLHSRILQYDSQLSEEESTNSFSAYVAKDFMGDRLTLSYTVLGEFDEFNTMNEVRMSYDFTDNFIVDFGADWFSGDATDFYGQYKDQNRVFTNFSYFF